MTIKEYFNKSGNNSGENSYDSIDNMNFDEVKEKIKKRKMMIKLFWKRKQ